MKEVQLLPNYPITLSPLWRLPRNDAERIVKGTIQESDLSKVQKMLSSGNWIAIDAKTEGKKSTFTLGWV